MTDPGRKVVQVAPTHVVDLRDLPGHARPSVSVQATRSVEFGWEVDVVGPLGHHWMTPAEARALAGAYLDALDDMERLDHRQPPPGQLSIE